MPPEEELAFLQAHPVQALWGVGPATLERLRRLGVSTVGDLAALPEASLVAGARPGERAPPAPAGDGRSTTAPVEPDRPLKSVGHEETFARDLHTHDALRTRARALVRRRREPAARGRDVRGRTITLKVRFHDFRTITRASTAPHAVDTGPAIRHAATALLREVDARRRCAVAGRQRLRALERGRRQLTLGIDAER